MRLSQFRLLCITQFSESGQKLNFGKTSNLPFLCYRSHANETHPCSFLGFLNTVKSRVEARFTIQKIKSLGVLQFEFYVVKGGVTNRDMSLTETC